MPRKTCNRYENNIKYVWRVKKVQETTDWKKRFLPFPDGILNILNSFLDKRNQIKQMLASSLKIWKTIGEEQDSHTKIIESSDRDILLLKFLEDLMRMNLFKGVNTRGWIIDYNITKHYSIFRYWWILNTRSDDLESSNYYYMDFSCWQCNNLKMDMYDRLYRFYEAPEEKTSCWSGFTCNNCVPRLLELIHNIKRNLLLPVTPRESKTAMKKLNQLLTP